MEDRVRGMDYYMVREYLGKNTPGIEAGNSGVVQKGQYFNQNMGCFSLIQEIKPELEGGVIF